MVRTNSLRKPGNDASIEPSESQMNNNQIDSLAKQLATAPSRRALLRLMAGGAVGAVVSGLGLGSPGSGLITPRSAAAMEAAKKDKPDSVQEKKDNPSSAQEKKDEPKSDQ